MQRLKIYSFNNVFKLFADFIVFAIMASIFFPSLYVFSKLLIIDYSIATLFAIPILSILIFFGYSGMRVFVISINHLYREFYREVIYDQSENKLIIEGTSIDLNTDSLRVIHHAPRYLLVNTEMKYGLKTYSKFEFRIKNKSHFISSILEFPEELAKTVRIRTKDTILKRHVWMTA
jgi:hypothetical protein